MYPSFLLRFHHFLSVKMTHTQSAADQVTWVTAKSLHFCLWIFRTFFGLRQQWWNPAFLNSWWMVQSLTGMLQTQLNFKACLEQELLDRAKLCGLSELLYHLLFLFDDAIDCGAMEMEPVSQLINRWAILMDLNSFHKRQQLNKTSLNPTFFSEFSQNIVQFKKTGI